MVLSEWCQCYTARVSAQMSWIYHRFSLFSLCLNQWKEKSYHGFYWSLSEAKLPGWTLGVNKDGGNGEREIFIFFLIYLYKPKRRLVSIGESHINPSFYSLNTENISSPLTFYRWRWIRWVQWLKDHDKLQFLHHSNTVFNRKQIKPNAPPKPRLCPQRRMMNVEKR